MVYACSEWNGSSCDGDEFTYTYDGAGNATRFDRWTGSAVETVLYTYNGANQLATACIDADHSGACDGSETAVPYTYDAYGNLTDDGTSTYTYDTANRLIEVSDGTNTTSYSYDGDGNRISQTVNSTLTTYVLDTATPLTMVLSETSNGQTSYYWQGLDTLAQSDGTNAQYFQYDGLGSVRQLSDASGADQLAQTFDPYGNGYSKAGTATSSLGYSGEQTDSNGFVFLRARYYNPSAGRFTQLDAWQGDDSRPATLNPYAYGEDNPILFTDPSGQCIFTGVDTIACLIALAIGIPVVAGATTGAWNFSIEQGGGVGGINQNHPNCIKWDEVLDAGNNGFLGATETEANIPLSLAYITSALVYGKSPTEVNASILSRFGLEQQYRLAQQNRYYVAGRAGGEAASTYISLATFLKGLPSTSTSQGPLLGQTSTGGLLVLRVGQTVIVGGNGTLVFVGSAGLLSNALAITSGNAGGSSGRKPWTLTNQGSDKIATHKTFGKFYRDAKTKLWWSKDLAGHGGSAFKVFKETGRGLEWIADADEYGQYIVGKHKGDTGLYISWNELSISSPK